MDLMKLLPDYYSGNLTMEQLQEILGTEISKADKKLDEAVAQCFVDSATVLLSRYENIYGIDVDANLSNVMRREVIRAKKRGRGTTTKKLVEEVAQSFSYGEVSVDEEHEIYTIKITFVGEKGIPANLVALKRALREIIPAHLVVQYVFTYATWGDVKAFTWGELLSKTWKEVKELEREANG